MHRGQVLLRLARCAGRLPGLAEEPVRPPRAGFRRLHGRSEDRAGALHRQGHHLLPHPVLAGDAAFQRPQDARPHLRARLHHRQRREDEQEPRHRHLAAALPRTRHERRVAALLHRRQAQRARSRTSTSIPTISSPASTATWSASTSTSRAARPDFVAKRFEGRLCAELDATGQCAARRAARRRPMRSRRCTTSANSARRCAR